MDVRRVAAGVLSGMLLVSCASPPDVGDSYGARGACEQFVEKRLKSPGSAEYSDQTESNDRLEWTASGTVDSQNAFGALIRNDYRCVMTYLADENESYRLDSLSGLEN